MLRKVKKNEPYFFVVFVAADVDRCAVLSQGRFLFAKALMN
jgi:hypothetical protein